MGEWFPGHTPVQICFLRPCIGLRGHWESDDSDTLNKVNFFCLGQNDVDKALEEHWKNTPKNATYLYKTFPNELLLCVNHYIQNYLLDEVKSQKIGPYYGIQCDKVRDFSNREQLGIVLQYVKGNRLVERLLEFNALPEKPYVKA